MVDAEGAYREVVEKLEGLRDALAVALGEVRGSTGEAQAGVEELHLRTTEVVGEALEVCERIVAGREAEVATVESLELEEAQTERDLATARTRLAAYRYKSKELAPDETYHRGSVLHARTHVCGMEPAEAASAFREAAESPKAFWSLRKAVEGRMDAGTMEILFLLNRLSDLRSINAPTTEANGDDGGR